MPEKMELPEFTPPEGCTYNRDEDPSGTIHEIWYSYPGGELVAERKTGKDGRVQITRNPIG